MYHRQRPRGNSTPRAVLTAAPGGQSYTLTVDGRPIVPPFSRAEFSRFAQHVIDVYQRAATARPRGSQ